MAPLASGKIIAAECALAVVTSHTALSAPACMMIKRLWRRHLPALWLARSDLMTLVTGFFLMFGMTEPDTEGLSRFRCAAIATQLMARSAGRDIAAA
jgi:hypothetical protein